MSNSDRANNRLFQRLLAEERQATANAQTQANAITEKQLEDERVKREGGIAAFPSHFQSVVQQLRSGAINLPQATQSVEDFTTKYDIGPRTKAISNLTNLFTQKLNPARNNLYITDAFKETFGRAPTAQERADALQRFGIGVFSSKDDLSTSLYKLPEYTKKQNTSFIDNYNDSQYGKQTVDAEGYRTGKRTFNVSSDFLPKVSDEVSKKTGVTVPTFGAFTGSVAEIEAQEQNVRDTRQYMYSAGLTALQGDIDKETQKLKNEGQKEIANITSFGNAASSLVSGFWS